MAAAEDHLFLKACLDSLSSSIAVLDRDGRILAVNDSWRRFAQANGVDPQHVSEGVNYLDVCARATGEDATQAQAFAAAIREVVAGRPDGFELQYPCHSPDEQRWFLGRVTGFSEPAPRRVVVAHENVTQREQMLRALEESNTRLHLAVQATLIGHWEWQVDTNAVYYSPQWKRQIGYENHELENTYENWESRLHPDDKPRVLALLRAFVEGTQPDYRAEFRLRHKDGSYRWIFTRADKLVDERGRATRLFGCHVDVTERKAMEAQLAQAQKMEAVGQLAGGVAHDFNNLLQAILGFGELLMERLEPHSEPHDFATEIYQGAQRGAALTRQLLSFSRHQRLDPSLIDLKEVLAEALRLIERAVGSGVQLEARWSPRPLPVRVDRMQIEQVLMNLCLNARDAMPQGGTLVLETGRLQVEERVARRFDGLSAGDYASFAVTDSGSGMDPATRERIFEPFFTTKDPLKGTGLGLAVCYGIVKQHGGAIHVDTEPGRGTRIEVLLPIDEVGGGQQPTPAQSLPAQGEQGGTILLAEDEGAVRRLASRLLEEAGYTVVPATTGEDALQLARLQLDRIDLALLDVIMPGQTGLSLAQALRELRADLPIILTTGFAAGVDDVPAVDKLGARILRKPIERSRLLEAVEAALAGNRGESRA